MKIDNRRKFQRIDFDGKADLQFTKYSYECCQIKNLSLTGMFVEGKILQRKRARICHVKIYPNDHSGNNSLSASAKVVWKNGRGVALQFTAMNFESYMLLQRTLIDRAEQPEIILRELPRESPFFISGV